MSESITLEVAGEEIVLDEAFMDFSDFSEEELAIVAASGVAPMLLVGGEPSVGGTAVLIAIKAARGRGWDQETFSEVVRLLIAWLTDDLELVD